MLRGCCAARRGAAVDDVDENPSVRLITKLLRSVSRPESRSPRKLETGP